MFFNIFEKFLLLKLIPIFISLTVELLHRKTQRVDPVQEIGQPYRKGGAEIVLIILNVFCIQRDFHFNFRTPFSTNNYMT
jgi:hypothetical protein